MSVTNVLLLGVPHLANPGLDMHNVEVDDVLSEHRQRELVAVATDLAGFAPTKVLVEQEPAQAEALDELFTAYGEGTRELGRGEVEQIGFRVAVMCGLEGVVPIDVQGVFWDTRIDELAATDAGVARRLGELHQYGEARTTDEQQLLATSTIGAFLRKMNSAAELGESLRPYFTYLAPIRGDDYPGADVVANWYRRNLHIFANLVQASGEGEHLLVVFGSGHVPVLRHYIEASGQFTVHEVADYLRT